jgi:hypothetical protein
VAPPVSTGLEIEILDLVDEPPAAASTDVSGVMYEPPEARPSRIEPLVRRADELERRLGRTIFRLGRRQAISRYGNVRRDSRVRLHVWAPFAVVREGLADAPTSTTVGSVRLLLCSRFTPAPRSALRAEATLQLRGSWPGLPVWVTIEPWWRNRTITTISLRRTHRWRYPRRYFGAAHAVGQELTRAVLGGN